MTENRGTLYGLGVGPGDPDLVTVKALKILTRVPHVFAASSSKNDYSLAQSIVSEHLPEVKVERLPFPMTNDRQVLTEAWDRNARRILQLLDTGSDAAFITLGDPMTYSTYCYVLRTLKKLAPDLRTVTVPGITSYHAAAAMSNTVLAEGEESFHLISGARGGEKLRRIMETSENVAMLKTYKHFDDIYDTLEDLNLLDRAICISRCGLKGETVVEDLRSLNGSGKMPYLSLVIIKKKGLDL